MTADEAAGCGVAGGRSELERICAKNDVARLRVFGSVAKGTDTPDSDVDLLVEFVSPKGLLDLIGLEQELADFLGREVDLLTRPP